MQNEILPIAAERFLFNRRHVCVLVSFNGQNFNEIVDTFLIGKEICDRKVCTGMYSYTGQKVNQLPSGSPGLCCGGNLC